MSASYVQPAFHKEGKQQELKWNLLASFTPLLKLINPEPFFFLIWSIVTLQCCVNFCYIAKWFNFTHPSVYLPICNIFFPLWFIPGRWPCSSLCYAVGPCHPFYNTCNSLHTLSPNPHQLPPPAPALPVTTSLFSMSESFCLRISLFV